MIKFTVNGVERSFDGDARMPLIWYPRDELSLTGSVDGGFQVATPLTASA